MSRLKYFLLSNSILSVNVAALTASFFYRAFGYFEEVLAMQIIHRFILRQKWENLSC